jgi:hypothetical protein
MFETVVFRGVGELNPEALVCPSGASDYQSYRIPSIVATARGRLVAFAEGRKCSAYDYGDIDLVYKTSDDGGVTWSSLKILAGTPDALTRVYDSASPRRLQPLNGVFGNATAVVDMTTATTQHPDGTIWLFFIYTDPKYGSVNGEKYSCADYAYDFDTDGNDTTCNAKSSASNADTDGNDATCSGTDKDKVSQCSPASYPRKKHTWSFEDPDDAREIYVTSSVDGGMTWTEPARRQDLMRSNYQWDNVGPGTGIQVGRAAQNPGDLPKNTLIIPAKNRNFVRVPGGDWVSYDAPTGAGEATIAEVPEGFVRNDRDGDDETYRRRVLELGRDMSASSSGWDHSSLQDPLCHASLVNTGGDFTTLLFMNPVGDGFALGTPSKERSPMWVKSCSGSECSWSAGRLLDAERGGYSSMVMFQGNQVASLQEWISRDVTVSDPRHIAFRRFNLPWVNNATLTHLP